MRETTEQPPAVRLRGVLVAYDGVTALRDVDLDLPRGRTVAIIGPNGSGKSTLLSTIAGLIEPVRGTVEVLGRAPGRAHHQLGYVLQMLDANEAVPLTVREVVTMGRYATRGAFRRLRREDRQAVDDALDRLAIADLAGRHLTELSGGQRQRVYVAQGLAQQAEILLLDEPDTGLDLPTRDRIAQVIREERDRGCTVILTTHGVAEAAAADHVVVLAGRLVASGTPDESLRPEVLSEAYGGRIHEMEDGTVVIDDPHHHHGPIL